MTTGIELSRMLVHHASWDEIEPPLRAVRGSSMGMSDPEVRKKFSEPRWLQYKHESDKQSWQWWKRLIHRFQRCPICKPEKVKEQ
jgi:hypothetical protein